MAEEYVIVDKADFETIANSVREKTNSTDKYKISELANAMANTIIPPPPNNSKNQQLIVGEDGIIRWADKPFFKKTTFKEIVSATGTASSGGSLYISHENPSFVSGIEYTVDINGTKETIVAAYNLASNEIELGGSNFRIYPYKIDSAYVFYSKDYSDSEITISISGPVEEITTINEEYIPESIARKEYVDSILPAYSRDNYKGTFVVNVTGGLEVQPYDWNYLSNRPFGKLDGYEPIAKLTINVPRHTVTFTSGDKYLFKPSNKYWIVDHNRRTGWLATASVMSSYDIYMLFVDTEQYPQATISEFDLAAGTYKEYIETTGGIIGVPTSIDIYNENEWGTKMMDETYIPSSIQRVGGDIIIPSSTSGSTKKFKITVDDSGTISATEVTT